SPYRPPSPTRRSSDLNVTNTPNDPLPTPGCPMTSIDLFVDNPLLLALGALVLGLLIGSFLNVVIYRLPLMMEREWRAQCQDFLEDRKSTRLNSSHVKI